MSAIRRRSHTILLQATAIDRYSDSAVDRETTACFFDFQEIIEELRSIQYLVTKRRVMGQLAQSASQYPERRKSEEAANRRPCAGANLMYRRRRWAARIWSSVRAAMNWLNMWTEKAKSGRVIMRFRFSEIVVLKNGFECQFDWGKQKESFSNCFCSSRKPNYEMAESNDRLSQEDSDYMGDLSHFLPPEEAVLLSAPKTAPPCVKNQKVPPPLKGKRKNLSWQENRRIERERKQIEEDAQTLEKIDKAPISQCNIGFKLLKQMGYTPGSALGKEGSGRAEPVGIEIRRSRAGIGREDPHKEKMKVEEMMVEKKRRVEKIVLEEFGSRLKENWKTRRVTVNYEKAKKALDHLENKPVEVKKKNEDEEDEVIEEEEEEEITEEDLLKILMQLREHHLYCLFCGCQYESMEALLSSCPGLNEDDH
ncbi:unnamed protein product [Rhodiola kirilowii]